MDVAASSGSAKEKTHGPTAASSSDVHVAEDEFAGEQALRPQWPERILGCNVRLVKGINRDKWFYFDRLDVTCPNPAHKGCGRSRSRELEVALFGPRSAEFWLGAWLSMSYATPDTRSHREFVPTHDAVQAYADSADCPRDP